MKRNHKYLVYYKQVSKDTNHIKENIEVHYSIKPIKKWCQEHCTSFFIKKLW